MDENLDERPLPDPPAQAGDLHALPFIGFEVIRLALDAETPVSRLEDVIRTDVALTQRLLRVANSAFYSRSHAARTVREAVVTLGVTQLRRVALATSVLDFAGRGATRGFDRMGFFTHSLVVGALAQELAEATGYEDPPVAFVAGLLHDVGKPFFDQHYAEPFAKALALAQRERLPLYEAERRVFSKEVHPRLADHAAMGRWAMQTWKLPDPYPEIVGLHHEERALASNPLLRVVCAANHLARVLGAGADGSGDEPRLEIERVDLGLSRERLAQAVRKGMDVARPMAVAVGPQILIPAVDAFCDSLVQGPGADAGGAEAVQGHA